MRLINLTPHPLTLALGGERLTLPPSGAVARVSTTEVDAGTLATPAGAIPVVTRALGAVTDLPAPVEGTAYVVSSMVLAGVSGRADVYAPDTGPTALRDEQGRVVAVTRLVRAS